MGQIKKILATGLATLVLVVALHAVDTPQRSEPASIGLTNGPGSTVLKNGESYQGIGVNYFDCFLRTLNDGGDTSYDAGFAMLAAKGIPFARFCATGFWPRDMKLYQTDRSEYFRRMDGVVRSAENHGIGLVPSLFWYFACVPDLVGEPMDQWGNPQSKTHAWMREYVREVVTGRGISCQSRHVTHLRHMTNAEEIPISCPDGEVIVSNH